MSFSPFYHDQTTGSDYPHAMYHQELEEKEMEGRVPRSYRKQSFVICYYKWKYTMYIKSIFLGKKKYFFIPPTPNTYNFL